MRNKPVITKWVGAAIALCATASQAALINLGDANITLTSGSPLINAGQSASGTYNNGANSFSTTAGVFKLGVSNPDGSPTSGTIYTFCTDIGIYWQSGQKYEALQFSDTLADGVNPPWSAITEAIENASWLYNEYFVGDGDYLTDAKKAAGMQLAIWKVLYDTTDGSGIASADFSTGNFRVTGGTANNANQGKSWAETLIGYLNTARVGSFTVYSDTWLHPVNDNSQGMIYNNLTPIPEPTTVMAGALLLLPFAASTIRIVRRTRTA